MKFDKDFLFWSLPVILWLLQHAHSNGAFHLLGRTYNHNETLVRDQA
ncbi:MAG TPA: hypothetical protein VGL29_25215 [Blastocatellia bacterium]|jgi:hypothetical protein